MKRETGERTVDDADLLQRVAGGDEQAFHDFYQRFGGKVASLLNHVCADRTVAEDLLQEVFVTVWKRAKTYRRERGAASGWLYAIARNKAFDQRRRQRRRVPVVDEAPTEPAAPSSDEKLLRISLEQAIDTLETSEQAALRMAYFGGLTYRETAERLEVPLGTLKSRIRSGLRKLQGVMR